MSNEVEIPYRPGIEVSRMFAQFNKWVPIFFTSCLVVIIIGIPCHLDQAFVYFAKTIIIAPIKPFLLHQAGAGHGIDLSWLEAVAWPIIMAFGAFIAWLTVDEANKPTHLLFDNFGIEIYRWQMTKKPDAWDNLVQRDSRIYKLKIRWTNIAAAKLNRKAKTRSHLDYEIEFELRDGTAPVVIRYGDIDSAFGRMQFVNALEKHLGDRFDPQIKQVFSDKGERESYTELWLKELNAPPKRDKLVPLSVGTKLHNGEYVVRDKIGMGGQAAVYLAESLKLQRGHDLVAIKEFILPVFPDPRVRVAAAQRFQTEAELISRINHPQIVRFLDLFIEDHRAYLVLERIEGKNLKQVVEHDGVISEEKVIALAQQMCDILSYLHGQNPPIAHRDFTPDNLMLTDSGLLKLIDFSVAQASVSNVTGSVVGKPEYIAPEQFRGKPTPLSDLYSLGGTMYFLLTGKNPEAISSSRPITCSNALADVIAKATSLDPAKRYHSAAEMKEALQLLDTKGGVIEVGERILQPGYEQ
jgi:tRNA A-37 threonylcarbamoyl transferase component Bud32